MKLRRILDVLLLGSVWGPSFLFIKLGIEEMSPFTMVAGRITLGSLLLLGLLKLKGRSLPRLGKIWFHFFALGFFSCSLPFVLFGFGEMRVTSALAGVINGITPIVGALLAHFWLSDERLSRSRTVGILLGLVGFAIVLGPHLTNLTGSTWGILAIGIASISYGVGMVYGRKYLSGLPPLVGPTCQLLVSSAYLIPLAIIMEPFSSHGPLTWSGIGSVIGLGVLGTACAFYLFFRVMEHSGATYLAMSTYLLPIFSTALGAIFLDEHLSWTAYAALGFILTGMMIVNGTIRLPFFQTQQDLS